MTIGDVTAAWARITEQQLRSLRALLNELDKQSNRAILAEQASVHAYDIRNFLAGGGGRRGRPRAQPGVRLLALVARQPRNAFPTDLQADLDIVLDAARSMFPIEADDDYLFRYVEKLHLMTPADCKSVARTLEGNHYMYRMSSRQGIALRSHVSVRKYSPFEKVPHFTNLTKFGAMGEKGAPLRRAEGQVISLNNSYAFLGFIVNNVEAPSTDYMGLKIFVVPSAPVQQKDRPTKGFFASFTHGAGERYEYGPMCLVRTADEFEQSLVGEFPIANLASLAPTVASQDLKLDLSDCSDENGLLSTCLKFSIFADR